MIYGYLHRHERLDKGIDEKNLTSKLIIAEVDEGHMGSQRVRHDLSKLAHRQPSLKTLHSDLHLPLLPQRRLALSGAAFFPFRPHLPFTRPPHCISVPGTSHHPIHSPPHCISVPGTSHHRRGHSLTQATVTPCLAQSKRLTSDLLASTFTHLLGCKSGVPYCCSEKEERGMSFAFRNEIFFLFFPFIEDKENKENRPLHS